MFGMGLEQGCDGLGLVIVGLAAIVFLQGVENFRNGIIGDSGASSNYAFRLELPGE